MPAFSKPVQPGPSDLGLPAKRKRTLNPKLTDDNNVHADAVKKRRLQHEGSGKPTKQTTAQKKKKSSIQPSVNVNRSPSIEEVEDEDTPLQRNAGPPKNPNAIIEHTDEEEDEDAPPPVTVYDQNNDEELEEEAEETVKEETAEQELGWSNDESTK